MSYSPSRSYSMLRQSGFFCNVWLPNTHLHVLPSYGVNYEKKINAFIYSVA